MSGIAVKHTCELEHWPYSALKGCESDSWRHKAEWEGECIYACVCIHVIWEGFHCSDSLGLWCTESYSRHCFITFSNKHKIKKDRSFLVLSYLNLFALQFLSLVVKMSVSIVFSCSHVVTNKKYIRDKEDSTPVIINVASLSKESLDFVLDPAAHGNMSLLL